MYLNERKWRRINLMPHLCCRTTNVQTALHNTWALRHIVFNAFGALRNLYTHLWTYLLAQLHSNSRNTGNKLNSNDPSQPTQVAQPQAGVWAQTSTRPPVVMVARTVLTSSAGQCGRLQEHEQFVLNSFFHVHFEIRAKLVVAMN